MNQSETRLARIAFFTLLVYVLALTVAWFCVDCFYQGPLPKTYQQTYIVVVAGGGGPFAVLLLLVASFVFWRVQRWAAIAGLATCLLWTAYAVLPRL